MANYLQITEKELLRAIADPTRRDILTRLKKRSTTMSNIAKAYPLALPTVSKHLEVLKNAQLIRRSRLGRLQIFSLNQTQLGRVKSIVNKI